MEVGNPPDNRSGVKRLKVFFQTASKLRKRLKKSNYDMIQINPSLKIYSLFRDSFYLWMIKKRGYIKRTFIFYHGWSHKLAEKISRNFFLRMAYLNIYKNVGIIAVLYGQCKQQLINIGIPSEKIQIASAMYRFNADMDEATDEENGKINILFMSRFLETKGIYIVAEVARLLVENGAESVKFIFVGDGPEYEGLQDYIAKHNLENFVDTPGFVVQKEKEEILRKSHIFLFPTYYGEGCPAVLLEAMGAGLAVISTPVAAIPEIVKNEENGFIIDSRNPRFYYDAVKRLIENKSELDRMRKLNRQKAKENYEMDVVIQRLESMYSSIIESTPCSSFR